MNLTSIASLFGSACSIKASVQCVCIDSRKLKPGDLFVAIRGDRFDGHDFLQEAANKGAVAALCSSAKTEVSLPQFIVKDTLQALIKLASYHRQTIQCPTIGLTGSNGKTTVKEMISAILPKPAYATPGNLNNHIGAPLSVLGLTSEHRYAVFELGANHLGEIARTVAIVRPKVALINNIAPAHIGEFGSIDGIAAAKGEIFKGLDAEGIAILNEDDSYAHFWDELLIGKKILRFSINEAGDVMARNIAFDQSDCASFDLILPKGQAQVKLNVPGVHNVHNALAAAACCYAAGIDGETIAQGLVDFKGVAGRMTFLNGKNQSLVIDDTYNANLRSVLAAVEILAKRQGCRILVLGDMGELGKWTKQHHEAVGRAAFDQGIDVLMTCGNFSEYSARAFGGAAEHYANQYKLVQNLLVKLNANTTILVKGSRAAAMEKIVQQLVG